MNAIADIKAKKQVRKGTILNYVKVLNKCRKVWPLDIDLSTFSSEEFDKYFAYCLSEGNQRNTINRNIKCIKTVLRYAETKNVEISKSALYYKLVNAESNRVFLSKDELELVQAYYENTTIVKYKKVLKMYLFGCYTGLRYSDIISLEESQIKNDVIIKEVQKSNRKKLTSTPLIPEAKELLGDYPYFDNISNQKCNKYLKEIAKLLSIQSKISFHSSRHTFAMLALNFGIPLEAVSAILSHSKVSTTQIYAKMQQETLVSEMGKFKL